MIGKGDKTMGKTSPAKVQVKSIDQVCLVVEDVQKTIENYWLILGIGPWDVYHWETPLLYDYKYYGKPSWARAKVALTQVGSVQLEIVEHVDGESIYKDFLDEYGEGLHHVKFVVKDTDMIIDTLEKDGFLCIQSGRYGDTGHYNYVDTDEPLRAIWEFVREAGVMSAEPMRYPAIEQESPAKIKVKSIDQVAIVVNDIELVTQNYWNILGIGPWDIYNWESPLVYDFKYYGKNSWARSRIAVTMVGNVMLELCQPVDGDTIYRDYLNEHGEGLHHLNFLVDDVDEVSKILTAEGFTSMQSGRHGPRECRNAFNYFDTKPLRTIWEPVHIGEVIGGKPIKYPSDC
jgi:4-hydroxyphenylpyruvate dioxygenase-like putative hemolysin